MGLKAAGKGTLQFVSDFADPLAEFAMLRRIVEGSGRPLSFSLVQSPIQPQAYKLLLDALHEAVEAGLPMKAQVGGAPGGRAAGPGADHQPFQPYPAFAEISGRLAGRAGGAPARSGVPRPAVRRSPDRRARADERLGADASDGRRARL